MFSIFSYLRRRVAEAVVGGVQDALDALDNGTPVSPEAVSLPDALRARVAGALPTGSGNGNGHAEEVEVEAGATKRGRKS